MILLDSDGDIAIFNNENYVEKITPCNNNIQIDTNGKGSPGATASREVPSLSCKGWFNEDSISNVTSLADMADEHRVAMDANVDKAFFAHLSDRVVRFGQLSNRLRGMNINNANCKMSKENCKKLLKNNEKCKV